MHRGDAADIDALLSTSLAALELSGVDVDEDDDAGLDDPALLTELHALAANGDPLPASAKKKHETVTQKGGERANAAPEMVADDINETMMAAAIALQETDADADFTDADMNDPHLLRELSRLQGIGMTDHTLSDPPPVPAKDDIKSQVPIIVANTVTDAAFPPAPQDIPEAVIATIESRLVDYKRHALGSKRAGDINAAKAAIVAVRQLSSALEQIKAGVPFDIKELPMALPASNAKISAVEGVEKSDISPTMPSVKQAETPKTQIHPAPALRRTAPTQVQSPPNVAVKPSPSKPKVVDAATLPVIEVPFEPPQSITDMMEQITSQIASAQSLAARYHRTLGDSDTALVFHRYRKTLMVQLDELKVLATRSTSASSVPEYHIETVRYRTERENTDLALNEMEVQAVKARGVGGAAVDVWVSWDVGLDGGTGETPVVRSQLDPEFKSAKKLRITRDRSFQRHLERKKAVFEVWRYRGFLRGSVSLGRGVVKLDGLLRQSGVSQTLPLVNAETRKDNGSELDVTLRLRRPMLGPEIAEKEERWVFLGPKQDHWENVLASEGNRQHISSAVSDTTKRATVAPPSAVQPTPARIAKEISEKVESDLELFNSVDAIVSHLVLEREKQRLVSTSSLSSSSSADHQDRVQAVQLRLQLLAVQVETGMLTLHAYVARVRTAIVEGKNLAVRLKGYGRMTEAKEMLARVKVMEAEIREVESSGMLDDEQ